MKGLVGDEHVRRLHRVVILPPVIPVDTVSIAAVVTRAQELTVQVAVVAASVPPAALVRLRAVGVADVIVVVIGSEPLTVVLRI